MSVSNTCCTPSVQASCCEPAAKESCCGTTAAGTTPESSACGCAGGQSAAPAATGSDPDDPEELPVAVIGAGPVGLAAAAHLLEYGQQPLILEAGDEVAAGVGSWGHVPLFSPWRYSIDAAARRLLRASGWPEPDGERHPTGAELRENYLLPLSRVPALAGRIRTRARVLAVTRRGTGKMKDAGREQAPLELVLETPAGVERILARAVIDASGALGEHNPLGSAGVPAAGEREAADAIAYGIPNVLADPARYAGQRVLVVGAGHSAMNVLQDLVKLREGYAATEIHWAVRRRTDEQLFGGGENDGLPARAALGQAVAAMVSAGDVVLHHGVRVEALQRTPEGIVVLHEEGTIGPVDQIVAATGFRPDLAMLREIRLGLDPSVEAPTALAPLIDPNLHSCGTVPPHGERELAHPEPDFYVAGMKSYGRAPTFLMLTGYEQVRSISAAIAGDRAAADRVELVLPETDVCTVNVPDPPGDELLEVA
jgi:flavin-dependent dehydrogenase